MNDTSPPPAPGAVSPGVPMSEQEPVAWRWWPSDVWACFVVSTDRKQAEEAARFVKVEPLYTHPVKASPDGGNANLLAFLDAGDAGRAGEEWLSSMARNVGIERGRIERFTGHMGEPQADAHTAMLWDGPQPLASYTVVRDDFNRSKLLLWARTAALASTPSASADEVDAIPKGWRFYAADASIPGRCSVMLTRDEAGTRAWHALDEAGKEVTALFVSSGIEKTFSAALRAAIDTAIAAQEGEKR